MFSNDDLKLISKIAGEHADAIQTRIEQSTTARRFYAGKGEDGAVEKIDRDNVERTAQLDQVRDLAKRAREAITPE